MDLDTVKQILDLVREHDLSELEVEQGGIRVKVRKDLAGGGRVASGIPAVGPSIVPSAPPAPGPASTLALGDADIDLAVVKSPIVGTVYRSPEPGAAPFVDVGTVVKKGQVLCIIEAMKLMNEIDSEYDGEVAAIYVESGQSVQYGERLFAIRTR
jgi:acetyl-CoA carboxylase biotin carboxyl carrier protein